MKKSLTVFVLLLLAAVWSVTPTAKTYSHLRPNAQPLKLHASSKAATGSMADSAEQVRTLAIRHSIDCPDGYHDCNGCCVPYPCLPTTQARAQ